VGEILAALGQPAQAIESFREAIKIMDPLAASDPGNAHWQSDLIGIYDAAAKLLAESGEAAQALDLQKRALACRGTTRSGGSILRPIC
jgi:tetratricopeptide (TPR) repeat protein